MIGLVEGCGRLFPKLLSNHLVLQYISVKMDRSPLPVKALTPWTGQSVCFLSSGLVKLKLLWPLKRALSPFFFLTQTHTCLSCLPFTPPLSLSLSMSLIYGPVVFIGSLTQKWVQNKEVSLCNVSLKCSIHSSEHKIVCSTVVWHSRIIVVAFIRTRLLEHKPLPVKGNNSWLSSPGCYVSPG